jgi:hypothetical protein
MVRNYDAALKAKAGRKSRNTGCPPSDQITVNLLKHHWVPSITAASYAPKVGNCELRITEKQFTKVPIV